MSLSSQSSPRSSWRSPTIIIIAGCLISMIGFGVRSSFGFFMEPISVGNGWGRDVFSLAMAIQNIMWGIGVFIAGAIADRRGPIMVLVCGSLLYAVGIYGMSIADSPALLQITGGLLTGLGVAFTAFSLVIAVMVRVVSPTRRTLVMGLGTAAGSAGQVIFAPISQGYIQTFGWVATLWMLAAITLLIIPLTMCLPRNQAIDPNADKQSLGEALTEALRHRGFVLLTIGFFVCGFHIAFIGFHLPAYVTDLGLSAGTAAMAMSIIGLCNILGAVGAGVYGQRYSMKNGLSLLYFLRAVAILGLILAPKTELTILVFSVCMGFSWLSTVPLTTAIVGQVFGVRYLATLFGFVFLSHQLGSFAGIYLGGYLFDVFGSYDPVWWAGVALGVAAAVIHLPINEQPLKRLQPAQ